ncbi:MAG: 16S rRNA (cytidine(1402)-2'-O)-methyltransferase [Litorimonas sp.]
MQAPSTRAASTARPARRRGTATAERRLDSGPGSRIIGSRIRLEPSPSGRSVISSSPISADDTTQAGDSQQGDASRPDAPRPDPQWPDASRAPDTLHPGLYVVATPIGNLRDITLRALDVLRAADQVLAEDTRVTSRLLSAYGIDAALSAYHDHNAAKRAPGIVKALKKGATVALVSDAGTPLVSDPGFRLVRAAVEAGVDVFPLPGASAVMAGLVKSGLPSDRFFFAGFLPPRTVARQREIEALRNVPGTLVLFETGPRVEGCLRDLAAGLGDRRAVLCRELTKRYEDARRGTLAELADGIEADPPRGEIVLLIHGPESRRWEGEVVREALRDRLETLKLKAACAEVAEVSGWSKRELYALGLSLKS